MTTAELARGTGYDEALDCARCGAGWNISVMWPEAHLRGSHYACCPSCGLFVHVLESEGDVELNQGTMVLFDARSKAQCDALGLTWVGEGGPT